MSVEITVEPAPTTPVITVNPAGEVTCTVTYSTLTGSINNPGGANGSVQIRNGASFAGIAPDTDGNVLTISDGEWVSATPDPAGMVDPGSNGVVVRTALNTTTARSIAAGTNVSVNNGSGVSGNPTVSVADASTTVKGVVELATDGEVASGLAVQANDARLSNTRTPTAHASTHVTGGTDKIRDATASQDGLMTTAYASKLDAITGTNTGDVTLGSTLADVATITGQVLSADDLGSDQLWGWDESAGKVVGFSLGTNLSVSGTTINASGGGGVTDGDKGDITVSGGGTVWTIDNGAVTLAKQADMATSSLVYRKTAGSGVPEINTLATLKTDLGLSGTNTGDQTITLTGDVTGSGTGSFAATIANDSVTYSKMQNVSAPSRLLGRGSNSGAGDVQEILLGPGLNMSGTTLSATGNIGGSTGSTDNIVLRSDGTGGSTLQSSGVSINDSNLVSTEGANSGYLASTPEMTGPSEGYSIAILPEFQSGDPARLSYQWYDSASNPHEGRLVAPPSYPASDPTWELPDASGTLALLSQVPSLTSITGPISSPTYIQMGSGSATTLAAGRIWYNQTNGTWNAGMGNGNITQQIGEELLRYGKASSAITDSPLQLVYKTGVVGASGVLTFAPAVAGITDSDQIIGCATENIALNGFGRVTTYGIVNGITTNGTAYSETWADNDDIYYNPSTGGLTKTIPSAPGLKVLIGTVIKAGSGGSGSFIVKLGVGARLSRASDVQITTPVTGDLLSYDATLGYWKNTAPTNNPAGAGTELQFRSSGTAFGAVTNSSVSGGTLTLGNAEALGTTPTSYLTLRNTSAAAAGVQQVSPSLVLEGRGWKTDATAGSQTVRFRQNILPVQGAANPTASYRIQAEINNTGTWTDRATVDSTGIFAVTNGDNTITLNASNASNNISAVRHINITPGNGWTLFLNSKVEVTSSSTFGLGADVLLARDAANTLALRNGANAQTFRVYNTFTSSTEHERGTFGWASNALRIGTEKGTTSGALRNISFTVDGAEVAAIYGNNTAGTPNGLWVNAGYRIGTVGRGSLFFLTAGGAVIWNSAETDFTLLRLGGTSSSFPALKRSSAAIQARLADDSGYTTVDAQHRLQGTAPATAASTGTAGDVRYDADYIYICVATNTWKRVAISTW